MSQFSNKEQESKFQEILQKVNAINFLTENDLRIMFIAGMEFEKEEGRKKKLKRWENLYE